MKKLVVFLAAALLAVGIVAGYLWQQLDESRNQNAGLQASLQKAQSAQQASAAALATQQRVAAAAAVSSAASSPATAPGDTRQAGAQRPGSALLEGARQIMSSPEGRGMVQPAVRGMIEQRFKGVGKALHLSAEEESKLIDTIARQQMDLSAASMDLLTGDNSDADARKELERKTQDLQRADEAELSTLLGSKYPQFQEFQSTMAARQQVDQLKSVLGASGGGDLDDAQSKSLVAALAAEQKRITQEANTNPVPAGRNRQEAVDLQIQRTVEANSRMVDAASGYLNAQQLDSYRKMLDQQTQLVRRVLGAMAGTGTPPAQNATNTP